MIKFDLRKHSVETNDQNRTKELKMVGLAVKGKTILFMSTMFAWHDTIIESYLEPQFTTYSKEAHFQSGILSWGGAVEGRISESFKESIWNFNCISLEDTFMMKTDFCFSLCGIRSTSSKDPCMRNIVHAAQSNHRTRISWQEIQITMKIAPPPPP